MMTESASVALQALGYALVVLGLIGAVLPVLPGPILIWLGVLVWAWADGFVEVNWWTLGILGLLAALAWASDLFFTASLSRRAGVSWRAIAGALVCGLLGGIVLSGVPVLGTLFGALLGALAGMLVIERFIKGEWGAAWHAVRTYALATAVSTGFELVIALLMVGIFLWQALL
jgi:uncharacterized protein YqgC (DUF456 family)